MNSGREHACWSFGSVLAAGEDTGLAAGRMLLGRRVALRGPVIKLIVIHREDYDYYCGLTWPKGTRKDSEYGVLFRACLSQTIDTVGHLPVMQELGTTVVLEDGHNNRDDAVRIYNWAAGRIGQHRALSGLCVADKSCLPLAAADLFAYSAWGCGGRTETDRHAERSDQDGRELPPQRLQGGPGARQPRQPA
jgi:hypothetical protein